MWLNIFICCTSETEIQQFIIFLIACDLNEKKKKPKTFSTFISVSIIYIMCWELEIKCIIGCTQIKGYASTANIIVIKYKKAAAG